MFLAMKHGCVSEFKYGCGTRQFLKKLAGLAIKKLLKYFYLYFLYIFAIKIFLKNTLLCLDLQNKERRRQETQNKKENIKEATNIQNKIKEWQI